MLVFSMILQVALGLIVPLVIGMDPKVEKEGSTVHHPITYLIFFGYLVCQLLTDVIVCCKLKS
jgi:hypothetical protein